MQAKVYHLHNFQNTNANFLITHKVLRKIKMRKSIEVVN